MAPGVGGAGSSLNALSGLFCFNLFNVTGPLYIFSFPVLCFFQIPLCLNAHVSASICFLFLSFGSFTSVLSYSVRIYLMILLHIQTSENQLC